MSIHDRIDRLRHRWANLHPLVRVMAVVSVLAAVAYPTAKPGYDAFKQWRMGRNLTAAGQAMDADRMLEARDLSISVIQAGDPGIEAVRILERSAASLGDLRHPEIARALIVHPEGTDGDRLTGFQGVVMDMPLGQVGQVWQAMPEEVRVRPEFATAFGQRLIREGRITEAAGVLVAVPEKQRDARVRQELVRLLIAVGSVEGFEEAQRMIAAGLAGDGGTVADGWLDVLEEIPPQNLRVDLLHSVEDVLAGSSGIGASRVGLLRCRLALAVPGVERRRALEEAITSWRDADAAGLARLLADLGEDELLLESVVPGDVMPDAAMMRVMWKAAVRKKDWETAKAWLEAHGDVLPNYEREACRAIVAGGTGDSTSSQLAWKEALDEAKRAHSGNDLLVLHRLASEAGFEDEAATAMIEAIRTGSGPLPLYQAHQPLICALSESGRERLVLEICAIYLALEPSNPVLLTQYAYLAYLLDVIEPGRLRTPLEALAAAFPKELPIHTTLAAILLAEDQAAEASKALEPFGLAGKNIAPPFRIIHLVTEVLNGRLAADDAKLTSFPWNELNQAERRKFGDLIRRAGESTGP